MQRIKYVLLACSLCALTSAYADDEKEVNLPTIQVIAEPELREITEPLPYLEEEKAKQALRYKIDKLSDELQGGEVKETPKIALTDYQPKPEVPNIQQLPIALQQHVHAVAEGFLSADPTEGAFKMLAPLNINRDNISELRQKGPVNINMNDMLRLQQQLRYGAK